MRARLIRTLLFACAAVVVSLVNVRAQSAPVDASLTKPQAVAKRAMTFVDVMKFRSIKTQVMASTGMAVAYQAQPDRGDGEVVIYNLETKQEHHIARGQRPVFSDDGKWVAVLVAAPVFAATDPKPMQGLVVVNVKSGKQYAYERVQSMRFSDGA